MSASRQLRRAEVLEVALAAGVAAVLFLASWALLHRGFYARERIVDTPIYERYGRAIDQGAVPYRDFFLEYPPAALPAFALPARGDSDFDTFRRRFEGLMAACGLALIALVAAGLAALGASLPRVLGVLGFLGLAPLAVGSLLLSRFDLWPAALTAGAIAALVAGRERIGHGVLGLGVAAKLYPAVIAPIALAYVWRRFGRREALVCGGILATVTALCFLPFLLLSPGGVWESFERQASRPLQIESLGSSLLLAAHHLFGVGVSMESSHGSQNLSGSLPDVLAVVQTGVQVAAVGAVWIAFARGPASSERLVIGSAAALTAFVAFGKVLSPQFLVWLLPLVPLVRGRRGLLASGLLALALVLTQLWFPFRYWDLALTFDGLAAALVVLRDLVLVALLVTLWPRNAEDARGRPHASAARC